MQNVVRLSLPLMEYRRCWELQRELVAVCRETALGAVLFVEHPPVITLGCRGRRNSLVATAEQLGREGIDLVHSDRGGDITYHGPGQLVVYPILQLACWKKSVRGYLNSLEEVLIRTLADFGVAARRSRHGTGVWVGLETGTPAPEEAKIASIGVRLSRWISSHGAALNMNNPVEPFRHLVPCGLSGVRMTSIREQVGEVNRRTVEDSLWRHLCQEFSLQTAESPGASAGGPEPEGAEIPAASHDCVSAPALHLHRH